MALSQLLRFERDIPVTAAYDVVVCGGGPAGCAAALAARRCGLSVLLIEAQGQLGGTGTSGLVSHWLGGRFPDGRWVVGGLFRCLALEAATRGFALLPTAQAEQRYTPHGWYLGLIHGVPFDPFAMAGYLDEKMSQAGVDVLLATQVVDAHVCTADARITHVVLHNKSGLSAVPVTAVVDATGDADLAARTGCKTTLGREGDGEMAPASLQFHVDGVDQDALTAYIHAHDAPRFRDVIASLRNEARRSAARWPFPYDILITVQLDRPGTMMVNTTRLVGVDGTDGRSVSQALARGRAEIQALFRLMQQHIPGFRHARIKAVAPMLGVRETRRIVGACTLTVDELMAGPLLAGQTFPDTIGYSMYGWDLPDPRRPSHQPMHGRPKPPVTPIPYSTMVPQPIDNLICPGRAVSVERHVLGPLRVMAPCMAMGEAAGQAAIQVIERRTGFGDVDTDRLRRELTDHGAILGLESLGLEPPKHRER